MKAADRSRVDRRLIRDLEIMALDLCDTGMSFEVTNARHARAMPEERRSRGTDIYGPAEALTLVAVKMSQEIVKYTGRHGYEGCCSDDSRRTHRARLVKMLAMLARVGAEIERLDALRAPA